MHSELLARPSGEQVSSLGLFCHNVHKFNVETVRGRGQRAADLLSQSNTCRAKEKQEATHECSSLTHVFSEPKLSGCGDMQQTENPDCNSRKKESTNFLLDRVSKSGSTITSWRGAHLLDRCVILKRPGNSY